MLGVWANPIVVILGALIGTLLKGGISERFRARIMQGIGLCVMLIGITGAIQTNNAIVVILSMVIGALAGEALKIEERLDAFGQYAQKRLAKPGDTGFAEGFVSATLLFCVGSMAVVGSLEAGLSGKPDTLLAKTALDGVTAVIFSSTMGIGVAFSAIPLLVYQGGIALLSGLIGPYLSQTVICEMSATGSLLILGLGLNMLKCTKEPIKVGNLLPAMFVPILYFPIAEWITGLMG